VFEEEGIGTWRRVITGALDKAGQTKGISGFFG